ncbi:hypothetical protein Pcinc_028778, partial [Petrolisthes cinctipes]
PHPPTSSLLLAPPHHPVDPPDTVNYFGPVVVDQLGLRTSPRSSGVKYYEMGLVLPHKALPPLAHCSPTPYPVNPLLLHYILSCDT